VGKCNENLVYVHCEDGRQITIEELVKTRPDTKILSYDETNDKFVPCKILNYWETGSKACVEVLTKTGRTITSTLDHKYLTVDGWQRLGDISLGSYIAVPKKLGYFGNSNVTLDEAACISYLTADGSVTRYMMWTKADTRLVEDFSTVCNRFNWELRLVDPQKYLYVVNSPRSEGGTLKHEARVLCQKFGIYGKKSTEKSISNLILTAPKNVIARFLQVLISSDGSFYINGRSNRFIEYSSASKELAYQVHSLLTRFGIVSRIRHVSKKCGEKRFDAWVIFIASEPNINLFLQEIGWLRDIPTAPTHGQDKSFLDVIPAKILERLYHELERALPEKDSHGRAKGLYDYFGSEPICRLRKCINSNTPIMRQKLLNLRQHPIIDKYLNSNILWDKVVSVKEVGKKKTYDLEIDTHHNYVANNIITHNSMTMAAMTVLQALLIPGYKTLHITPLYQMIHRFSVNYVKPFIDYSPIRDLLIDSMCTQAISQRNFLNGSILYFSFASRDVTRTRGFDAYRVCYDEVQNMDSDFIPIINQTTSGAPANMRQIVRAGTPMTMENSLQKALASGSWAEWVVRCPHCNHWNIPDLEHDLDKMLGPKNPKWTISREQPGVVCGKCQKPLNTRLGLWVHKRPEVRFDHASYHIPQLILPQHCESDQGWRRLQSYRQGAENTTPQKFYNELMGVSYDHGARLITLTELQAACTLPVNAFNIREAIKWVKEKFDDGTYVHSCIGVDWGGGGKDGESFSVFALGCLRYDGKVDIPFAYRSLTPHKHMSESNALMELRAYFNTPLLAVDWDGQGPARCNQLHMLGVPEEAICRLGYTRISTGALMRFHNYDSNTGEPAHWTLDKSRSLLHTCQYIKHGFVNFFQYDAIAGQKSGLIDDFLSLYEEKIPSRGSADIYVIGRDKEKHIPDDFADAVNYAAMYLWGVYFQKWPDIKLSASNIKALTEELLAEFDSETLEETIFDV
jgi:intein/homing endonuclease